MAVLVLDNLATFTLASSCKKRRKNNGRFFWRCLQKICKTNGSVFSENTDSSAIAKDKLPHLKNCKLKTLVKHFELPKFKHHDAAEDSIACARIFLKLIENEMVGLIKSISDEASEFKGIVMGILADNEVNYKEAYELLYWLEDHPEIAAQHKNIYVKTKEMLEDDHLDNIEAIEMKLVLDNLLKNL